MQVFEITIIRVRKQQTAVIVINSKRCINEIISFTRSVRGGIQNNGDLILGEVLWEKRMNMKKRKKEER
jgi:hypothetical protein